MEKTVLWDIVGKLEIQHKKGRLVSRRSIGGLKRTHTFLNKSRVILVLWTVDWGYNSMSQTEIFVNHSYGGLAKTLDHWTTHFL